MQWAELYQKETEKPLEQDVSSNLFLKLPPETFPVYGESVTSSTSTVKQLGGYGTIIQCLQHVFNQG